MLRGSRPAAIGCVIACVVIPWLAGCGSLRHIGAGAHTGPATTFTVTARVTTLIVHGGTGSITVTGTGRSTILVSQRASYSKTPPAATHVVSGTTLTLGYSCPAQLVCGMAYDVQVPRGVAVRADASAGAITLTSLAGPITAQTNAGLISATRLSSPAAELKSNAGGIDAAFTAAPGSVHASTNVGPITINVPGSASYQIQTRTFVGTSTVTVPENAASPHTITASSDLGSITISPS
jgi:hypothetical protein